MIRENISLNLPKITERRQVADWAASYSQTLDEIVVRPRQYGIPRIQIQRIQVLDQN